MRMRTVIAIPAISAALVLMSVGTAHGGGSSMSPVLDRYEPGDRAELVGYVGPGQLGWVQDGPFTAWLRTTGADEPDAPPMGEDPRDIALGPLTIVETGLGGYLSLRVSIAFVVPATLPPGQYGIAYTDAGQRGLGDLMGGAIRVGLDPEYTVTRRWPPDDPAWAVRAAAGLPTTDPDDGLGVAGPAVPRELSAASDSPNPSTRSAPRSTSRRAAPPPALVGLGVGLGVGAIGVATLVHFRRRRDLTPIAVADPRGPLTATERR